jgi:D-serine deaminase-like pyridoxal phosphate-dependent protein
MGQFGVVHARYYTFAERKTELMDEMKLAHISVPTALIAGDKAKANIRIMAAKAANQNIRFRPHFKTHQSAAIGEWFREESVKAITVSSVRMADYFAGHGWDDILIGFPVNLREIEEINRLAGLVNLSILVESGEVVEELGRKLGNKANVWIKVDTGMGRAGIRWDMEIDVEALCRKVLASPDLRLAGLLTHAGQTYHASSPKEILNLYADSNRRLIELNNNLQRKLGVELQVSVGDTPGCWLSDDLGAVDEIRPGNFLLFDAMMVDLGVCHPDQVAIIVACPVVAKHPWRNEVVIYGGAIHLSKEYLLRESQPIYGYALEMESKDWRFDGPENFIFSLSQEHGIVRLSEELFGRVKIGDLIGIMPVHSCLAVDALGYMLDFQGNRYDTLRVR